MRRRRQALCLVVLMAGAMLVTTTSGVSSMAADRSTQVAVTDDEKGYLGVEQTTTDTANGTTNLSVTVTNQFPPGATVERMGVTVDGERRDGSQTDPLRNGQADTVTFESVSCDDEVGIVVTGDGFHVQLTRAVACP